MNHCRFIGLCGPKHAGKDTVAHFIMAQDENYHRVAFADVMKEMAIAIDPFVQMNISGAPETFHRLSEVVAILGWEKAKEFHDVRRFLQRLGTEGGRNCLGDNIWITTTWERYVYPYCDSMMNEFDPDSKFVFTDVRFANEISAIQNVGGQIWRVNRAEVEDGDPHPSERQWRDIEPDVTIENDTTLEDLEATVDAALNHLSFA